MQGFLAEYGLSTREGVALMCLAEALLRVPDTETIDALRVRSGGPMSEVYGSMSLLVIGDIAYAISQLRYSSFCSIFQWFIPRVGDATGRRRDPR